jgi:hypothetical protein
MTLKWYGNEVHDLIDRALLSAITAAAIETENSIVNEIDRQKLVKSGRYKGSITFKSFTDNDVGSAYEPQDAVQQRPKKFEAFIGTALIYARRLEFLPKKGGAPRAAVRKGWDNIKNKLDRIFTLQFKKIFK